ANARSSCSREWDAVGDRCRYGRHPGAPRRRRPTPCHPAAVFERDRRAWLLPLATGVSCGTSSGHASWTAATAASSSASWTRSSWPWPSDVRPPWTNATSAPSRFAASRDCFPAIADPGEAGVPGLSSGDSAPVRGLRPHDALAAELGQQQDLSGERQLLADEPEDRVRHDARILEARGVEALGERRLEALAPDRDVDA